MTEPTTFQKETVKVACLALRSPTGSRRFLIADEAGLGKTIVAQRIIREFSTEISLRPRKEDRTFNIIYVCSNLAIARQNQDRLLGFLTKAGQKAATVEQDRLSLTLLPQKSGEGAKRTVRVSLRLYAVTPKTSMLETSARRKSTGGTTKERALSYILLKRALGYEIKGLRAALALRVRVAKFRAEVRAIERDRGPITKVAVANFKQALRTALALKEHHRLSSKIGKFLPHDAARLVQYMRLALANVAIANINPDLVIFDEFQRFEDLICSAPEDVEKEQEDVDDDLAGFQREARRLLYSLRGDEKGRALLLLSATPWIPYRSRAEINPKVRSSSDGFIEVVRFLFRSSKRADVDRISTLLLKRRGLLTVCPRDWAEIDRNHDELLALLMPVMARTERRRELPAAALETNASVLQARLQPDDLMQFKAFHECVEKGKKPGDLEMLVPLWNSVPLPMQSLGPKYRIWDQARKLTSAAGLQPARADRLSPTSFPHPRLRALIEHLPAERLALPWVAPSHEWWPLVNAWQRKNGANKGTGNGASAIDGKVLIFARFRAVVPAVAGLVSYHVEAAARRRARKRPKEGAFKKDREVTLIRADAAKSFELFHPCPFLIEADPIAGRMKAGTVADALRRIERSLESVLRAGGIGIVSSKQRGRQAFELVAGIEAQLGSWENTKAAWQNTGLIKKLPDKPAPITEITAEELARLAQLALSAPGVVLGRAIQRHSAVALEKNFGRIVDASWKGLRTRFDEPWIARTLKGKGESFPDAIRRAVVEGNLEATLDEHFWFLKQTAPNNSGDIIGELVEEFCGSISLNRSSIRLHYGREARNRPTLTLRCHVATPFTRPDHTDEESVRPDEVRKAFNSPFWPHVLVTTSIGQEGLDFHPWCQTLLHWDPPPGPVALEQREGRVDRYASLAIRRAIARDLGHESNEQRLKASPWENLAKRALDSVTDDKGLQPWWIFRNARPRHLRFELANSEICERWNEAHEERGHYRLVLGMPNQNDLLGDLKSMQELDQASLARACLDFSPINRVKYGLR
jgi:hypothetical protein